MESVSEQKCRVGFGASEKIPENPGFRHARFVFTSDSIKSVREIQRNPKKKVKLFQGKTAKKRGRKTNLQRFVRAAGGLSGISVDTWCPVALTSPGSRSSHKLTISCCLQARCYEKMKTLETNSEFAPENRISQ